MCTWGWTKGWDSKPRARRTPAAAATRWRSVRVGVRRAVVVAVSVVKAQLVVNRPGGCVAGVNLQVGRAGTGCAGPRQQGFAEPACQTLAPCVGVGKNVIQPNQVGLGSRLAADSDGSVGAAAQHPALVGHRRHRQALTLGRSLPGR